MTTISVPVILKSSHDIQNIGFKGSNSMTITDQWIAISISKFGLIDSEISITAETSEKMKLIIKTDQEFESDNQIRLIVEHLIECLSFQLSRDNKNSYYGTNFLDVEWHDLNIQVSGQLTISGALGIELSERKSLALLSTELLNYHEFVHYYFEGLKANNHKSKYFHWFLILEGLEHSKLYNRLFNEDKLFNHQDIEIIKKLTKSMDEDIKKSVVLGILSRTKKSRKVKLYEILGHIECLGENEVVEDIGKIIESRNILFHQGQNFDHNILCNMLYPIITFVIEKLILNPNLLD